MTLRANSLAAAWIRAVLLLLLAVPPLWFASVLVPRAHAAIDSGLDSLNWPSTAGYIRFSDLVVRRVGEKAVAEVRFSYTVNGRMYEGEGSQFGGSVSNAETVHEFQVGPATVYYSPNNPAIAVLRPGVTPYAYAVLVLWYAIGVIPVSFLLWKAIAEVRNAR